MKFITKKDTETGKKFAELDRKCGAARKAQSDFLKKVDAEWLQEACLVACGGISALKFKTPPGRKLWRAQDDGYMPRGNTKQGKILLKEIESMPTVSFEDVNSCIGLEDLIFDENGRGFLGHIGFNSNNDEYYGFFFDEKWNIKVPDDCTEVTVSEYNSLFKQIEVK